MPKVRVILHNSGEKITTEPMTFDQAVEAMRAAWQQLRDTGQVPAGGTVEMHVEVRPRSEGEKKQDD